MAALPEWAEWTTKKRDRREPVFFLIGQFVNAVTPQIGASAAMGHRSKTDDFFLYCAMRKTLVLLLMVLFLGCSKDESLETGPRISLQQAVEGKAWKITGVMLVTSDGGFLDIFNTFFADCEKDDSLRFNADGKFTLDEAAATCGGQGRTVFYNLNDGFWGLSSPDSMLAISKGFNNQVYKVSNWSERSMTWKQESTNYLGIKETLTYSLVR